MSTLLRSLIGLTLCLAWLQASSSPLEAKVKAAYLYNFTKFVEWPDTTKNQPLQLCVVGDSQVAKWLDEATPKGDKGLTVTTGTKNLQECHLLYLGATETIPATLKMETILTVSDNPTFKEHGGMITLFLENGKIRFEINMQAVKKSNLKISSKLLELAKTR